LLAAQYVSISGALTWHKAKLHNIDVHHFAHESVQNTLHQLHSLACKLETPITALVKDIAFALVQVNDIALFPVPESLIIAENFCKVYKHTR
jgi:hypothetical protein